MIFYLKELFLNLPRKMQWQLFLLQIMVIVSSVLEVAGIGASMPFVAVVTDPD